jgi:hypothetical protein
MAMTAAAMCQPVLPPFFGMFYVDISFASNKTFLIR